MGSVQEAIMEVLSKGPMNTREIRDASPVLKNQTPGSLCNSLLKLKKYNMVELVTPATPIKGRGNLCEPSIWRKIE